MLSQPERTPEHDHSDEPFVLEDRLRADEPPISADDTNPSRAQTVTDRLRAEEPPLHADDTNPSCASLLSDEWPPRAPGKARRLPVVVMLLGAILIAAAAAAIWALSGSEDSKKPDAGGTIAAPVTQDSVAQATAAPTATDIPRSTAAP